jgi:hypothetical protein
MLQSIRRLFAAHAEARARTHRQAAARRRRAETQRGFEQLEERRLMAADFNDQIGAEAIVLAPLSLTSAKSGTGAVDNPTDVDMWEIKLPSISAGGEYVDFDIDNRNGSKLVSYLRIFNADGKELARNDGTHAPFESGNYPTAVKGGLESFIRYKFTSPGRYYVGVSAYPNATYNPRTGGGDWPAGAATLGDYRLIVSHRGPDVDDQLREAHKWGSSRTGNVRGSDVDMHHFYAFAGSRYKISTTNTTNAAAQDVRVRVFDASGREIAKTGLVHQFHKSGDYYVGVSRNANSAYNPVTGQGDGVGPSFGGDYRLNVDQVFGSAFSRKFMFTNGTEDSGDNGSHWDERSGNLTRGDQVDMYVFQVRHARHAVLIWPEIPAGSTANVIVRVFDGNGKQIAVDPSPPRLAANGRYERPSLWLEPGVYYIGVSIRGNDAYDPMTGAGLRSAVGGGKYTLKAERWRV